MVAVFYTVAIFRYNGSMRTDYLNPQLYNKLYSVMTYQNVLALRVSLETGLRIDDVLSLRSEQLKSRKLEGFAKKTEKKYKKTISKDLFERLNSIKGKNYVFPKRSKPNEHRTRQAVWANMKKAAKVCGVELNAAPHSARKTYAVELFKDGGLNTVQRELQHDRVTTTMLYAFSNLLTADNNAAACSVDVEVLSELIADKVVEKLNGKGG